MTSPGDTEEARPCQTWLEVLARSAWVVLPVISDDEVRQESLRAKRFANLRRLDQFLAAIDEQPITTELMLGAAELWATARQQGRLTADAKALDADVILAAQARSLAPMGWEAIVATDNVGHLGSFVDADTWDRIPAPMR